MGWILDASGAIVRAPVEASWWTLLKAVGEASHMMLTGAYLVVIARFLRMCAGWREDRALAEPFRQVSALLCFCAVAHAGDAVAAYLVHQRWVSLPSILAAALAAIAALKVSQFTRRARHGHEEGDAPAASALRLIGGGEATAVAAPGAAEAPASVAVAAAAPTAEERQEWIQMRMARMEDMVRRNAWLLQRREAVDGLGALLASPVDGRPSGPEPPGAGPRLRPGVGPSPS